MPDIDAGDDASALRLAAERRADDELYSALDLATVLAWAIGDEDLRLGLSPGDVEPYVYVGPWNSEGLSGDFWNAPFGAVLSYRDLLAVGGDQRQAALAFLRRGAGLALSQAGEVP